MSRAIKKSLIALSVSTALFAPSVFATNGYFSHGYSTKEKGLAGAGVAYSTDALAVANNPAGIAGMGERMDVGAALFSPPRSYTVTGAPSDQAGPSGATFSLGEGKVDSNLDMFLIPHFAYNWKLDNESSVAFGMYANGGMNSNYKGGSARTLFNGAPPFTTQPGTFGAGTTGIDLKQLFLNVSYATKINASNSVGASLIFAYQLFEAKGLETFGNFGFSESPANLSGNGVDSSTGFGVKLGWQGEISKDLTLGASYQTKMSMSEYDDYAGLFAEQGGFDIPATASLGFAWSFDPKSTLVFDVQTIFYSDVPSLNNPVSNFTVGGNQFGSSNGPGFGWDDMTILKVGYEWYGSGNTAYRLGISNGSQPIPNSEVLFNLLAPAVIETHITGGFTMPLSSDSEFSFAAMYGLKNSVTGPNPLDPGQTIKIEMYQYEFQATYSMMF